MNLGKGFVVEIQDEKTEKQLLRLLLKRHDNYPIIVKIGVETHYYKKEKEQVEPMKYIISSLDGVFLTLKGSSEIPQGLTVRSATPQDSWMLTFYAGFKIYQPIFEVREKLREEGLGDEK